MTVVAQTDLCEKAADLRCGYLGYAVYSRKTSKYELQDRMQAVEIPDIASIMRQSIPQSNGGEDNEAEGNTVLGVPFIESRTHELFFVGILIFLLVLTTCAVCLWRNRRK